MTIIKRIESGETSRELADEVLVALGVFPTNDHHHSTRPHPLLSLDDAVGLVGEEWHWQVACYAKKFRGVIGKDTGPRMVVHRGIAPTAAAALTIAILRAKGVE